MRPSSVATTPAAPTMVSSCFKRAELSAIGSSVVWAVLALRTVRGVERGPSASLAPSAAGSTYRSTPRPQPSVAASHLDPYRRPALPNFPGLARDKKLCDVSRTPVRDG